MYVRSIAAGCVAAIALNLPAFLAPRFTLDTTGAVRLDAVGHEARYGIIAGDGASVLTVSLGATGQGQRAPAPAAERRPARVPAAIPFGPAGMTRTNDSGLPSLLRRGITGAPARLVPRRVGHA